MSRRVTYFNSSVASIPNPTQIFGANLFEWWDYTDLATQSITGGLIDSITSKGINAGVFASSGTSRPQSVVGVNSLNVADFDGVNDFMEVAGSTAMYNFLHNGSLGTVIMINRIEDLNPDSVFRFLGNYTILATDVGYSLNYDDRSSVSRNNSIFQIIVRGASPVSVSNFENNYYPTQQYNIIINKIDANASPAAERSAYSLNGGLDVKNNTHIAAPSIANATTNLILGCADGSSLFLKGQIPEIIILNSHPTPTQITQLNNYLTNKYGAPFPIV